MVKSESEPKKVSAWRLMTEEMAKAIHVGHFGDRFEASASQELPSRPVVADNRNLVERNLEKVRDSVSQLELIEKQLEIEIANREERLRHVRISIQAFSAAEEVLRKGELFEVEMTPEDLGCDFEQPEKGSAYK